MVNMANSNKQNDDGVLRAGDIIPPYNTRPARETPAEQTDTKQQASDIPRFNLAEQILAEQRKISSTKRKSPGPKSIPPSRLITAERAGARQEKNEKSSGVFILRPLAPKGVLRRTAKDESPTQFYSAVTQPAILLLNQQQIIAEIVAKDIAKLSGDLAGGHQKQTSSASTPLEN